MESVGPSPNKSAAPVTVFLEGAHIRCRPEYQKRHLDVVVGKVETSQMCLRFGLVQQAAQSPFRQLRHGLKAIGWDRKNPVTVISDGEPASPNLVCVAVGNPVHYFLDWWHISMRIKHVENAVKGLAQVKNFPGFPVQFERPAERLRWCLWHGKVRAATTGLRWLLADCGRLGQADPAVRDAAARVQARCRELYTYLANNMDSLTNYGWRYRNGLPISSSRVEGCMDDIGNARMRKRRRMSWSPKGAHRVAVVRAAVLDSRLTGAYRRTAA